MATQFERAAASRRTKALTPKQRAKRRTEYNRRYMKARYRTFSVLAHNHQEEYERVFAKEMKAINKALGPMVGDE